MRGLVDVDKVSPPLPSPFADRYDGDKGSDDAYLPGARGYCPTIEAETKTLRRVNSTNEPRRCFLND